ncbi:hypothetical protein DTL70_18115 [Streptomyces diacarni]|uniref:Uncharacterized protein n=1 Tax=Streptomyces diacarni TaxID=2800381 RepID=A0A367EVD7_9ACTN|nr:hypothetical protein [Streptomyces diacarni]RCG21357.1 hypothetical protein DTL70_18115 [Streptomyces diacarni]
MRKAIKAGISAVAVGTALWAGAVSAQAAGQSTGVDAAQTAPRAQFDGWEYENWYFSFNNCSVAGGNMQGIKAFRCEEKAEHLWHLYVLR